MKLLYYKLFFIGLIILNFNFTYSQTLVIGEQLEYDVSYLGVSFAKVIVNTDRYENLGGKAVLKTKAKVYSYDHVPLVSLKADFESWTDRSSLHSLQFTRNLSIRKKPYEYQKLTFDYNKGVIENRKWIKSKQTSAFGLPFNSNQKIQDALAAFFKLRTLAEPFKSRSLMIYLDEDFLFNTTFNFAKDKQSTSVSAINYDVRSIYFSGNTNWKGQYGISGKIEGWISDDNAKIPLKAKVDFILGKINIELVSYRRSGWNAPKG